MSNGSSVPALACVIPARGGSRRFPRKNIALLRGVPLLAYAIRTARESGLFADVWVSTDDDEIGTVAGAHGARVHTRPVELAGDHATLVDVGLDFAGWLNSHHSAVDLLCILLPTAVLLEPADLRGAFELFRTRHADFAMAVTTYLESPFWALEEVDGFLRLHFGRKFARRSQLLPQVQVDSGSFYFLRVDALERERTLYGDRLVGYPIPRERSIDIDEPAHLLIAEALLQAAERRHVPSVTT